MGDSGARPLAPGRPAGRDPALHPYACERGQSSLPGELQLLDLAISGVPGGETHQQRVHPRLDSAAVLFHSPAVEGANDIPARGAALAALPATLQYWPMGAGIALSGDVGYSYGLSGPAPGASADASYVHVWCRRGANWWLALQLRTLLPRA